MDYKDILYEVDGAAAVVTLNRPEKLNAWTDAMGREVPDAFRRAEADPDVVGVILTGAGRGFCAGADMGNLNSIADAGGERGGEHAIPEGIEANYHQRFSWPLQLKKPLIGAINGPAAGIGLNLSLYCDMRFASEDARFGTAFSAIGLVAEHGVSWLLPRFVGMGNALDLLYSSRVISAEEAKEMGLVQRVYPAADLLPQSKAYIETLARKVSPNAIAAIKKLAWDAQFQDLAGATQSANTVMAGTLAHPDFKEGLNAFAEKRPPRFQRLGS